MYCYSRSGLPPPRARPPGWGPAPCNNNKDNHGNDDNNNGNNNNDNSIINNTTNSITIA